MNNHPSEIDLCSHCKGKTNANCPDHGIAASLAREDAYWRRVGDPPIGVTS